MSAEDAKQLAKRISAVLGGHELPVVATALVEVMAILIVWMADEEKSKKQVADRIAKQALTMAEAITLDMLMKAASAGDEAEEKRIAELLKAVGPKQASPWGNVR